MPILAKAQLLTVINDETNEPMEFVSLISTNPTIIAETNSDGRVDITPFKGVSEIKIVATGYGKQVWSYQDLVNNNLTIRLAPLNFSSEAVVVSANRWDQDAKDIPFRVATITPQQVLLNNPQTAADMLGSSGEVFIQKSQMGGGSPMIRGFSTNRLLYTVDGVRMNTAIFRGGNIQNVISLDPFAIENTEILFGPGSVMYGSDAIGAVMSFQTLHPQLSLGDETFVTGAGYARYASASSERTAHFDFNIGWNKWALVTSFTHNEFGDLKMGSNGPDEYLRPFYVQRIDSTDVIVTNPNPKIQTPSGYSQMNLMQKIRFSPNDKWDFTYGFHYSETSDYARYDRHIRYKNGLPRYGEWSYGPQKWMMNNLSITHKGYNSFYDIMNVRLAYQEFEESRISRDFNDVLRETRIENVYASSANIDFTKGIGKRIHLYFGGEFVYNDVVSRGINEDISTGELTKGASRYPQATWLSYSAYITSQYKLTEKLMVQGGVRYSRYALNAEFDTTFYPFPYTTASMDNGALTGSIGGVYQPNDKWSFSLNASTGFRSPNVDDMGKVFDSEPGAVVVPNPDLTAEYAYNVDFGVTKIFGNTAKLDITGYYTILENALVRRDYTLNGMDSIFYDGEMSKVQAIQNAAVATVYGVQLGVDFNLTHGWSFRSNLNYQLGEEELDDGSISPSRHAAPFFGNARLTYVKKQFTMQFYSEFSGEKAFEDLPVSEQGKDYIYAIDANGNPYSPAWYTLNLKASYQFERNITITGGVENITDQRYKTYSSGIVAPGRNLILGLKIKF